MTMNMDELNKANQLYREERFIEASNLYKKLALDGNFGCARRLGWMYLLGEGVEKDLDESQMWLEQAVMEGDEESQFALGRLYLIRENLDGAYKSFQAAADQNFAPAIYRMAWMHLHCDGFAEELAEELLERAADLGNLAAKKDLGLCLLKKGWNPINKIRGFNYFVTASKDFFLTSRKNWNDPRLLY